jgi:AcrR family transcriptional regulator
MVGAMPTARERARARTTESILAAARTQLAEVGAAALSLRAVAREVGLVSSAVYRYFPSRDELLTALIIEAYDAVGEAAEAADAEVVGRSPRERWLTVWRSVRTWALDHPAQYALIYGSPVPGYRAPEATVGPASRMPLAFIGILGEAGARAPRGALPVQGTLAEQAAVIAAALARAGNHGHTVPPDVMVRGMMAWTQLFGMVSFELFGQFVGSFDPSDALFAHAVAEMTAFVGL